MKLVFALLCTLGVQLVVANTCPEGSCDESMTCCTLPSGKIGCCPYKNATCCPDQVHCCPHGYDCSVRSCRRSGTVKTSHLTKLLVETEEPVQYKNTSVDASHVTCPDQTPCGNNETCCSIGRGNYGCCPAPHAVCCSDLKTCCYQGERCDGRGGCLKNGEETNSVEIVKKTPVNTICPGGEATCDAGYTCCPLGGGMYGCCPLLAATCCRDRQHCCPHGYRCDGRGSCYK